MNRRFVNLIMRDLRSSIYSVYRMDVRPLFYQTAEIAAQVQAAEEAKAKHKKKKLSMVEESWKEPPKPAVNFNASNFVTLFRENSIMIGDSFGRTSLLDTDFDSVVTTPPMRNGKGPNCISFLIPNPDPLKSSNSQCLYVLDLVPGSSTFEYLIYLGNNDSSQPLVSVPSHLNLDWVWRDLPVPPFTDDPSNCRAAMKCSSMLLDRSTMCVSQEGIGTYTFDMVRRKWSRAGNWALPFCGKAEYVPNLKLWFALSPPSSPHSLCALDLPANAMDFESPPHLVRTWDYLHLLDESPYKSHLVNLGSGMFCLVSFFKTFSSKYVQENVEDETVVLTGLEVRPCNNSDGAVRMIKHMSKRCTFENFAIHRVL